jgi:hypothetical protein
VGSRTVEIILPERQDFFDGQFHRRFKISRVSRLVMRGDQIQKAFEPFLLPQKHRNHATARFVMFHPAKPVR